MGKKSFAVLLSGLAVVACGGGSDARAVSPWVEDGSVARASIASSGCGAQATLIELPAHCRWPTGAQRRTVLARAATVVTDVDANGKPSSARIVEGAGEDEELDAAIVACAMQGTYRPAWNGAGETCPTTIRLARYATDLAPRVSEAARTCAGGGVVLGPSYDGATLDVAPCQVWMPFR